LQFFFQYRPGKPTHPRIRFGVSLQMNTSSQYFILASSTYWLIQKYNSSYWMVLKVTRQFCTALSVTLIVVCLFVYSRLNNLPAIRRLSPLPGCKFTDLYLARGTSVYTVSSERSVPISQSGIRTRDVRIITSLRCSSNRCTTQGISDFHQHFFLSIIKDIHTCTSITNWLFCLVFERAFNSFSRSLR
jgi:hypothetical protein